MLPVKQDLRLYEISHRPEGVSRPIEGGSAKLRRTIAETLASGKSRGLFVEAFLGLESLRNALARRAGLLLAPTTACGGRTVEGNSVVPDVRLSGLQVALHGNRQENGLRAEGRVKSQLGISPEAKFSGSSASVIILESHPADFRALSSVG